MNEQFLTLQMKGIIMTDQTNKVSTLPKKVYGKINVGGQSMVLPRDLYEEIKPVDETKSKAFDEIMRCLKYIGVQLRLGKYYVMFIVANANDEVLMGLGKPYLRYDVSETEVYQVYDMLLDETIASLFVLYFGLKRGDAPRNPDMVYLDVSGIHILRKSVHEWSSVIYTLSKRNHIQPTTITPLQGDTMNATNEQTQSESSSSQTELETKPEQSTAGMTQSAPIPPIDYYTLIKERILKTVKASEEAFGIPFTPNIHAYIFHYNFIRFDEQFEVDKALAALDELTAKQLFELSEILHLDGEAAYAIDNWLSDFCRATIRLSGDTIPPRNGMDYSREFEQLFKQLAGISHRLTCLEDLDRRDGLEVRGRDSRAHDHFPHDNRDDRRPTPRSVVPGRRGEGRSPRERDNEDRFGRGLEYRR